MAYKYCYDLIDVPSLPCSELLRLIEQTEMFGYPEFKKKIWEMVLNRRTTNTFGITDRINSIQFACRYSLSLKFMHDDYLPSCVKHLDPETVYFLINSTEKKIKLPVFTSSNDHPFTPNGNFNPVTVSFSLLPFAKNPPIPSNTNVSTLPADITNPERWGCALVWISLHPEATDEEVIKIMSLISIEGITVEYMDIIVSYRNIPRLVPFVIDFLYSTANFLNKRFPSITNKPTYPPPWFSMVNPFSMLKN